MPTFYLNTFAILSIKWLFKKNLLPAAAAQKEEDEDYGSKSDFCIFLAPKQGFEFPALSFSSLLDTT